MRIAQRHIEGTTRTCDTDIGSCGAQMRHSEQLVERPKIAVGRLTPALTRRIVHCLHLFVSYVMDFGDGVAGRGVLTTPRLADVVIRTRRC